MSNRVQTANKLLRLAEVDTARADERMMSLRQQTEKAESDYRRAQDDLAEFELQWDTASRSGLGMAHLLVYQNQRDFLVRQVAHARDALSRSRGEVDAQERHLQRLRQVVDRAEKVRARMQREQDVVRIKKDQREMDDRTRYVPSWGE
ncbi:MAG: flagellar FliJ family protein [bacterium]